MSNFNLFLGSRESWIITWSAITDDSGTIVDTDCDDGGAPFVAGVSEMVIP